MCELQLLFDADLTGNLGCLLGGFAFKTKVML